MTPTGRCGKPPAMNFARAPRLAVAAVAVLGLCQSACITTAMGRGPTDRDLENDGATDVQLDLYRNYEVVYEQSGFRRPGAEPQAVAKEVNLSHVDSVSASAWRNAPPPIVSVRPSKVTLMPPVPVAFVIAAK